MRFLVKVLLLTCIILIVVGFYRNWFSLATQSRKDAVDVELKIDKSEIKQDVDKTLEKVEQLGAREKPDKPERQGVPPEQEEYGPGTKQEERPGTAQKGKEPYPHP